MVNGETWPAGATKTKVRYISTTFKLTEHFCPNPQ